ncbi:amidase signature enzyme [Dendrothele bispora CBS 962.96]|uniref:Glutamyl-tRNA(Gln) amidotransferase subunit A, mitochondrial n=1 Tax=Dendrothele bispora (strain CBS 962.96) TaxID=1314807 RepID=A0A4S8MIJ7_DENBC|nr:amidase signature enzyme [Dendrothele bispora CBS 962.96]
MRANVALGRTCFRLYSTFSRDYRAAIHEANPGINAFVSVSDKIPSKDGPLQGTAIAVKDNICTSSMKTTCSSAMLENFTSPFDATVVKLLQQAGADIIGKTNCDEFGMGSMNTHSVHGPVINPFRPKEKRSAGGSSGGSAAAVAAGMCDAALATDTGGSIRLPASYCGISGLKPSYGLISRWGVVSYADSLDCVGVMAKTVPEVKRVFDVLNVHDAQDPTSVPTQTRLDARRIVEEDLDSGSWSGKGSLDGLTIGVPQEYFPSELSSFITHSVRKLLVSLQHLGARVVPVSLPSTSYALSAYYVLASAEASSNLARYDGIQYGLRVPPPPGADTTKTSKVYANTRSKGFGEEVKKRVLLGTYALTADAFDNYFLQALQVRQLVREDFDRVFRYPNLLGRLHQDLDVVEPHAQTQVENENTTLHGVGQGRVDVLIHPSAIRTAPPLTFGLDKEVKGSSLDSYVQDVLTVPASLAGLPALSVPVISSPPENVKHQTREENEEKGGWPIGASIVGQWGCDELVLRVGRAVEEIGRIS